MTSAGTAVFCKMLPVSPPFFMAKTTMAAGRVQDRLSIPEQVQGFIPEPCPVGSQRSPLLESWGRPLRCLLAPSLLGNCSR